MKYQPQHLRLRIGTVSFLTWRQGMRAAPPRVSLVRWWLYRLATAVAASFLAVAILFPSCRFFLSRVPATGGRIGPPVFHPCPPWSISFRVEMALTGILVGLAIAFIGALIDHLIVRSRRSRGVDPFPIA